MPAVFIRRFVQATCPTSGRAGVDIVLDVRSGRAEGAVLDGQSLAIAIPDHGDQAAQAIAVRHQLEWWYRGEAERIFQDRATYFAQALGLQLKSVAIKTYKARWGSCGPDGDILFDWRLVMAPMPVIDYVTAHEVAHMRHPDHSPAFWACVASVCADYRDHRDWLRTYGATLAT